MKRNKLKAALRSGKPQYGIWLNLASAAVAELASYAGFDWCLIDCEHGPHDLTALGESLRALEGSPTEVIVRVPIGEDWVIKQALDLGAQSLLIPLIHSAEEAARAAAAMRYPPEGSRGIGASIARVSGFGTDTDYLHWANNEVFTMVQVESRQAVKEIDGILATPGVDAVFVGPADLSADMGFLGQPEAPEVQAAMDHVYAQAAKAGVITGTLNMTPSAWPGLRQKGVQFLGIGADATVLRTGLTALAKAAKATG